MFSVEKLYKSGIFTTIAVKLAEWHERETNRQNGSLPS